VKSNSAVVLGCECTSGRLSICVSDPYRFDTLRPVRWVRLVRLMFRGLPVAGSKIRMRFSRDRSLSNLLLTIDDFPPGWRQDLDTRYRNGLGGKHDWDKRARREKLIAAQRTFGNFKARSRVTVYVSQWATDDDVRSVLAAHLASGVDASRELYRASERVEVTPPPEAGEHATATLTTEPKGSRRLIVRWPEQGALSVTIMYWSFADAELWALTSELIQRQRERLAARSEA
jgi:hypothetical protein